MSNKHTHGGRITFFNIYVGRVKKCTSKIKKCMMGLRSPRFVFEFFCYEVLAKQKKYKRAGLDYFRTGDTIRTLPYLTGFLWGVKVKCKKKEVLASLQNKRR